MKKSQLAKNSKGSAGYIVAHAKGRASRGKKRPSEPWGPYRNPIIALERAKAVISRLDELGLARQVRCPFCDIGIDGPTDYERRYRCACGAQYWAESIFDSAGSCQEWAEESGVDGGEFSVIRGFDFLTDDEFSLPEEYDEWVLIFARSAHQKSVVTMIWQVISSRANAMQSLALCVQRGWRWKIGCSTIPEDWLRANIVCRAVLARQEGRSVHFNGREFSDLQKWEDAISSSGQNVSIDRDDASGFWVKLVGPEPTKH